MALEKKLSIGGKAHIHIISGHKPIRNLYAKILERQGYLVSEFSNPRDEKKHAENAHLIVTDRGEEHRKNGYKLAEDIQKKYHGKKPVVLMEAIPKEKDYKRDKFVSGKFLWGLEIEKFSEEITKIIENHYSMNVFVVGNPKWALKTRQTIVEEMPFIYNDLESAINNMERARGMLIGHPVARFYKLNSEKVSGCAAFNILREAGYEGIIQFYELSEKIDKEEITKVIQKMA